MAQEHEFGKRATQVYAAELARLRQEKGFIQASLATRLRVHRSMISHIEHERKLPTRAISEQLDQVFGLTATKHFVTLYERIVQARASLKWFVEWLEAEERAVMLQSWDPLQVSGLLQTLNYARAVIGFNPLLSPEEVEMHAQKRVARRSILNRTSPPAVWILLDESVLHRPIGGAQVLAEQLRYLLDLAQNPRLTIQIVPTKAGNAAGLMTGFHIARLPNGVEVVSTDSIFSGQTSADTDLVAKAKMWYEAIKADAYPQGVSIQLIEDALSRWQKE
ncbi:Scr1 family TA system antitoxin-like transcriptional regulator [Spongiactinospora sp. 9N601]|uniref:helix-turn-helix domain-containing protein n=1 Tax=Spongiactinospora sp. 9N601 TaxID=3375149 RepID=UPI003799B21B